MQRANLQYWQKHHSKHSATCYYWISCLHMLLRFLACSTAMCFSSSHRPILKAHSKRSLAALRFLLTGHGPTPHTGNDPATLPHLLLS
jgi:hypothetical protein